ncbi:molecular chaperone [Humibacillus sp. DSM 29435]|uniref:TorD/DmsD family molecular chaperone n=1 Tax=Humibacillus sp. DSM 29435 TaxID=1869167 RepID=UPI000AAE2AF7|nr:molecular chaperone TorD family protein [Humibacillus sp. DSM 29435]
MAIARTPTTTNPEATAPVDPHWLDRVAGATSLLSRLLLGPPHGPLLVALSAPDVWADWPFRDDVDSRAGLQRLSRSVAAGGTERLEQLGADYQQLFLGPQRVLACPYESVYLGDEHLTFGSQTLAVRQWYRRYGLRAPAEGREPDDHIGLELGFVSHLCVLGLDALEQGSDGSARELRVAVGAFAAEHLLRWADECLDHVAEEAATDFYRGVAGLTRGVLRILEADLGS